MHFKAYIIKVFKYNLFRRGSECWFKRWSKIVENVQTDREIEKQTVPVTDRLIIIKHLKLCKR